MLYSVMQRREDLVMIFSLTGFRQIVAGMVAVFTLLSVTVPLSADAAETKYRRLYDPQTRRYVYVPESSISEKAKTAFKNPIVKQAAIGSAVGAAAGLLSDRTSILKGAGVGALTGAGAGLVDNSQSLSDNPLLRRSLKGALIGTGASVVTHGPALKGALVGAGAGAGYHYLKDYLLGQDGWLNGTNEDR
jgi:hypothetical protein